MRKGSFSIVHLGIAVFIVIVLLAIMLPVLATFYRTRVRSAHSAQLADIHRGLISFANNNKNWYPGLDSQGAYAQSFSNSITSSDRFADLNKQVTIRVEDRYALLLAGEFIAPELAVSPAEIDRLIKPYLGTGPLTDQNYSYAMSQVPESGKRHDHWRQTLHSEAVVMGDRNVGTESNPQSIFSGSSGWRGVLVWNDNHVTFENQEFHDRYVPALPAPSESETAIEFDELYRYAPYYDDQLFSTVGLIDTYLIHSGN